MDDLRTRAVALMQSQGVPMTQQNLQRAMQGLQYTRDPAIFHTGQGALPDIHLDEGVTSRATAPDKIAALAQPGNNEKNPARPQQPINKTKDVAALVQTPAPPIQAGGKPNNPAQDSSIDWKDLGIPVVVAAQMTRQFAPQKSAAPMPSANATEDVAQRMITDQSVGNGKRTISQMSPEEIAAYPKGWLVDPASESRSGDSVTDDIMNEMQQRALPPSETKALPAPADNKANPPGVIEMGAGEQPKALPGTGVIYGEAPEAVRAIEDMRSPAQKASGDAITQLIDILRRGGR